MQNIAYSHPMQYAALEPAAWKSALMRYRLLGKSGVRISEVALGTMTFGEDWGWGASPDVSARMLDLFADAGGNVIDTADAYTNGTSETILGDLLKGRRDRFVLATKFTNQTDPGDPNSAGRTQPSHARVPRGCHAGGLCRRRGLWRPIT